MGVLTRLGFFQGALPEAARWGVVAIAVGGAGLLLSFLFVLRYLRDLASLRQAATEPSQYRPPSGGVLATCLGTFFEDPLRYAPLSPDAVSDYVADRLDGHQHSTQAVIRYLAYAPLLIGLLGTTLSLRQLLGTGGRTLQDIQPLLGGVFAGTLAGILGSLMAAVGGLAVDRTAGTLGKKTQDFVHRYIIPNLPERRVAIRIEETVMELIAERTQAVVESVRAALVPLAEEMSGIALRCADAAEAATLAFGQAARAVKDAGNLEAAARSLKSSANMIDSASELLSDATRQTAETVVRIGEVKGSVTALLEKAQTATESLGASSERVGVALSSSIDGLKSVVAGAQSASDGLSSAVAVLSGGLVTRLQTDSAEIAALKTSVHQGLSALDKRLTDLADLQGSGLESAGAKSDAIVTELRKLAAVTRAPSASGFHQEVPRIPDGPVFSDTTDSKIAPSVDHSEVNWTRPGEPGRDRSFLDRLFGRR